MYVFRFYGDHCQYVMTLLICMSISVKIMIFTIESLIFLLEFGKVLVDPSFQDLSTSHNLVIGLICIPIILTLSRPLDVNYVLEQGRGHGHLSKYLISGFIFHFIHEMKK